MTARRATLSWRPLSPWTGPQASSRATSPFTASRADTERLLAREAAQLGAVRVVIEVDAGPRSFRAGDQLGPGAKITFPGVAVYLDSRHGPLRYATDVYDHWEGNLRGIALALEALRAVDRYGVSSRGQQYQGWSALPAGTARDVAKLFDRPEEARRFIQAAAGDEFAHLTLTEQYHLVRRRMHPDAPKGDGEQWARLQAAVALLGGELGAGNGQG